MSKRHIYLPGVIIFLLLLNTSYVKAQNDIPIEDSVTDNTTGIVAFLSGSSQYIDRIFYDNGSESYGGGGIYSGDDEPSVKVDFAKERETMTLFFDPATIAMRVEFSPKGNRKFENSTVFFGIQSKESGRKKAQPPMYFDNNGYVYTGNKKQGYVKVSFEKLSKLMPGQGSLFGIPGLPGIGLPDGSVTYYGVDVSPKKFPVLKWAFVYKAQNIDGNPDFTKEILSCLVDENCVKYTLKAGEDAGSYVLFDSKERLREISTKNDGFIIYTYQEVTVKLPPAKDMSGYF